MSKNVIIILLSVFLSTTVVRADNLAVKIELKAAEIDYCSSVQPCVVSVEKRNNRFIVTVKKAALITKYGVIKYKSGSTNYHIFNDQGLWLRVTHTL